jgi:hypothetical protein
MTIKTYYEIAKAVMLGLIILAFIGAGLKGYAWINMQLEYQESQHKIEIEQARQYKQYNDNLVRAHTEVVKSLKNEIKELDNRWDAARKDIKEKNEEIVNMGETVAKLNENVRDLRVKSDHTYKEGTGDYNEQHFKKIMYKYKDEDLNVIEVPIAWAIYFPNREPDKQWKTGVYPLEYHSKIVQSEQEDGQINIYTEVYFENNKDKSSRGIEVPVKIANSEFKQLRKENKEFFWWAPHINFTVDFGIGDLDVGIIPGVSVSIAGYGRTYNDLDWKFIELGVNSNGDDTYFKFMPFSYNIGNHIPLVSNTFLGPFVGFSTEAETVFGVGLSIPF